MQSTGETRISDHRIKPRLEGAAVLAAFTLLLSLLLPATSQAGPAAPSDYQFFHLTIHNGLSQSTVRDVLQDHRGFLWFGTQGGLDRYDGTNFRRYRYRPEDEQSLSDNSIRSLAEDAQGMIWIGTNGGGVNRLDPTTNRFQRYRHDPESPDSSLQDDFLMVVWIDPEGRVFAGNRAGLAVYEPEGDWFRPLEIFQLDEEVASYRALVGDMVSDGSGGYWIGTYIGLYHWNPENEMAELVHLPTSGQWFDGRAAIRGLLHDPSGDLWVASERQGLFHRSPGGEWERHLNDPKDPVSINDNGVWDIHRDSEDRLWVATNGGLSVREPGEKGFTQLRHSEDNPTSLVFNEVHCISEDSDGTLWFGTFGGGLSAWNVTRYRFGLYNSSPNRNLRLSYSHVMAVETDGDGGLWVGSDGGGVDHISADRKRIRRYRAASANGPPDDRVWALLVDSRDRVWMGTFGQGLSRLDRRSGEHRVWKYDKNNEHSLVNNFIADFLEDSKGRIWIATLGGELCRYDEENDSFIRFQRQAQPTGLPPSMTSRTIYEDRDGQIWYGTNDGLHLLDPETGDVTSWHHNLNDSLSLGHNVVLSILEDRAGRLWVGTRSGGLSLMDREAGTFRRYGVSDGLPDDMIYGIIEDDAGALWLSSNNGLCRFDPGSGEISVYKEQDGLQANEFNQGAYHKGRDGILYFGGVRGITWFDPANQMNGYHDHPMVITKFQVMNQAADLEREPWAMESVTLPYNHNMVSFEFTSLNYLDPHRMYYRYKLEGVDEEWVEAGDRRYAAYTNLSPGKYTFLVHAGEVRGSDKVGEASFELEIVPPFWRTSLFLVLASMLIFGTIGGGLALRFTTMHRYSQRLETEVASRTELLASSNQQLENKRFELEELAEQQEGLLAERQKLIGELQHALGEVKALSGLIPICASCKKVRDDRGYWNQVEDYISKNSDATFTHGICPDCKEKALKDLQDRIDRENGEDVPPQVY